MICVSNQQIHGYLFNGKVEIIPEQPEAKPSSWVVSHVTFVTTREESGDKDMSAIAPQGSATVKTHPRLHRREVAISYRECEEARCLQQVYELPHWCSPGIRTLGSPTGRRKPMPPLLLLL